MNPRHLIQTVPYCRDFKLIEEKNEAAVRFSVAFETSCGEFISYGWRYFPKTKKVHKPLFLSGRKSFTAISASQAFVDALKHQVETWYAEKDDPIDFRAVYSRLKALYAEFSSWVAIREELHKAIKTHGVPQNPSQTALVLTVELLARSVPTADDTSSVASLLSLEGDQV